MRDHPRRTAGHRLLAPLLAVLALLAGACGPMVTLESGDVARFVRQPLTSQVHAADGTLLAELHGEQDRVEVDLDEVADVLVQAVIAIEDRRFFLHAGVDLAAIARAAIRNVEGGQIEQGGSTITQQYVKNTITGPARTMERKVREAALAWQLEQEYSKQEILERYLNTVYFGNGAYGIAAAARRYFDKPAAELTLVEAAQLAGNIASPTRFDPHAFPEAAAERRALVLDAMVAVGQLTAQEAAEAKEAELVLADRERVDEAVAPYFVAEVKRLVQHDPRGEFSAIGLDVDERVDALFTGGLKIFTTLDPDMQRQAEAAVASVLTEPDDPYAALVAIDPGTGGVRALVGGRDYNDADDPFARFNLATQGRRQPGSSFKPLVLATALSKGVSPDRTYPGGDCVSFRGIPDWAPCNYGGTSYGPLSLREATVQSANTVFARLTVDIGARSVVQTARTMGITTDLPMVPAIGLGAGEVTVFDMAQAYSAFPNLGVLRPAHLIERIEGPDGEVLYEADVEGYRVLDESVAWLVNQTLSDVVLRGTGVRAGLDRPQAGKTGTSQDSSDAWFVGYTPDLVAAVWVGFPEGRVPMVPPRTRQVVEGGRWPAEIWGAFAEDALADVPPTPFPAPDVAIVAVEVDGSRDCLPNPYTPPDLVVVREYVSGMEPTTRCTEPSGPPIDDVPLVVGFPLQVALQMLEDQGFVVDVRPEASNVYPTGVVSRQRPGPEGRTLERDGNAVVLWVSSVVRTRARVPDVSGLDVDAAMIALEDAGWIVEWREECPEGGCTVGARRVWQQVPAAGEVATSHTIVRLSIAP